jgi:hypothetical protein
LRSFKLQEFHLFDISAKKQHRATLVITSLFSRSRSSHAFFRAALWCVFLISGASTLLGSQPIHQPSEAERQTIEGNFDLLPLRFEPNRGQSSSDAEFLAQGGGFSALFKENRMDFLFTGHPATSGPLSVTLLNASRNAAVSGEKRLPGTVNYFIGSDREKWHTGLPTFERLRYTSVYPGTDLIYYGNKGSLEFDFQLSPGAAPSHIQMRFDGARRLRIDRKGDLIVTANDGQISFQKPVIYQPAEGGRKDFVAGSFKILQKDTVSFAVARYDRTRPLIIDPILNYSTYIGQFAEATAIAVNQNGEAYVIGVANQEFPTTPGSDQPVAVKSCAGNIWGLCSSPFVAKFNNTGTALLYSTFLTGSGVDTANGIALDANGDAFIAGSTSSTDFPITTGALQTKNNASGTTGFVTELNSTGASLLYSTYLGGSTSTTVNQVAIDASGNAYLTGYTEDTNFPTTTGAFRSTAVTKATAGSNSAFIAKLNSPGTALVYSTYLGGSQGDAAFAIAVDSAGEAYVGGNTSSSNFPVTPGAIQGARAANSVQAGFVTKLNASGSALVYSTYLSGEAFDNLTSIALDSNGNAYVAGSTTSPNFPITSGAFQPNIGVSFFGYPQVNAFVSELNSAGTFLVYSTFLGGGVSLGPYADEGDQATGIAVDGQGMVYLTGMACTGDFPVTAGAFEPKNLDGEITGECTAFLSKLNPVPNTSLVYSTFLGGTGNADAGDYFYGEEANGLAVDPSGNVYLAGFTRSIDFPTTPGVVETAFGGPSEEAFVTEFKGSEMKSLPIPTVTLTSSTSSVLFGQPVTFTATVHPASGNNTPTGNVGFNFFQQEASDNEGLGVGFGPWTTVPLNSSGVATFTTSSLDALQTQVNAFYLGDTNNAPATGTMTQTLTDIPTTTTVTSSANNVPYSTAVVFTATVLDNTGKPANGFVSFVVGNTSYAEPDLDSAGQATWVNGTDGPVLPVGTDTVKAGFFPYTGYQKSIGTLAETFTPLGTTADPTFAPPAGTFSSAQQVTLVDPNSAALIYYTTNGSTPVPGTSPQLPAGLTIPVNASETINAIAVAPGYSPSNVVSAAFTINLIPPVQDFTLALAPQSMTVLTGGTGSTSIFINGLNAFNGTVSFSCSGLPAGTTCTFAPASVSGSGGSILTIATSVTTAMNGSPRNSRFIPLAVLAATFGFIRIRRRGTWLLVCLACALPLCVLNGCGGGGGNRSGQSTTSGPTSSTYTVNITGTSGSLSHSTPLSLTLTN